MCESTPLHRRLRDQIAKQCDTLATNAERDVQAYTDPELKAFIRGQATAYRHAAIIALTT